MSESDEEIETWGRRSSCDVKIMVRALV